MDPLPKAATENAISAAYTASRIADALGISKRSILRRLSAVTASRALIIAGNAADAWELPVLPAGLQEELQTAAARRGYRSAEHLLSTPSGPWQPKAPWTKANESARIKATRLQKALAPALERLGNLTLSESEFERLALADYKRVFGFSISARHWRRLFDRTLERDRGAENFTRPEIYLDERVGVENSASEKAAAQLANDELARVVREFKDPVQPSIEEEAYLWTRVFEHFEATIEAGKNPKKAKRQLLNFLFVALPSLAISQTGIRKQFERKFEAWIQGGRLPSAVKDKRPQNSGRFRAPKLSETDRDTIVGKAVLKCGGRLAQAWRDAREAGELSEDLQSYYLSNPADKAYVPKHVRDQVKHKVAALDDIHHGPRQAQLGGAFISRDWECVPAGDWYQADDCTLPIYYYEEDGKGWYTLWRGQFLLMVDLRSTRILGYCLLSNRNYNSLAIRTLITKVCDEHGLPRKGFYFERGIWKTSKILKGEQQAPLSMPAVEGGLRDIGLKFIHARLPRAKIIEGVLGALQNLMEGEPGYAGRDERNDKFERVQKAKQDVEARRMRPQGHFLAAEDWLQRLDEVCERYNAAEQKGKMTGGLSPDEAFAEYQNPEDLQTRFDASCRYLLAHHRRPIKVTPNGITLRFGKQVFNYRNEETGKRIGETVLAWFNPEVPEFLSVTDMERKNPFIIERSLDVPAIGADEDILGRELSRIAAHQAHAKSYYRMLKAKFAPSFRRNDVHWENAVLGAQIGLQSQAARDRRQKEDAAVQKTRRISRSLNLTLSPAAQRRPESAEALERLNELLTEDSKKESSI